MGVRFGRFEFGIRIEQSDGEFSLRDDASTDTKLILDASGEGVEWRTFCCCRGGRVIEARFGGLTAYSGTSDEDSGLSNVGFNCRIDSVERFRDVRQECDRLLSGKVPPFAATLADLLNPREGDVYLGPELDRLLVKGLRIFCEQFGLNRARVYGPTVEGIGTYPKLNAHLEGSLAGLFVAGDATGVFRGLPPALISGYYTAKQAANRRVLDADGISSGVPIKRRPIELVSTVFTAQSKKFFYCRDAVCAYVLGKNRVPINPFRVFDYFHSATYS